MKAILVSLIIVMSLVLAMPALAAWTDAAQTARTTESITTTDPNVLITKPDQMVKTAWIAPFIRFDTKEQMAVEVKVIESGGHGQMLRQIASNLEGMTRGLWAHNQKDKNIKTFTGTPRKGELVVRHILTYVVGQNSNRSTSSGSNGFGYDYGYQVDSSRSDSQSTTTQESYVNLHTELVRVDEGDRADVEYPVPDIQAYENGTIAVSGSTSGSNRYDSDYYGNGNGCHGRNRNWYWFGGDSYNQHHESWSWTNSRDLLEAKSARSLAQYLADGHHALLCQEIKADQALGTPAK